MFVLDSFDIGSKYYWLSMYVLFFELIRKIQFTCKLYVSYKPSQYILLIHLIHFVEKICKIYEPITHIFRTKFMNFISKFYTTYGLRLYILLKNTMKCALSTLSYNNKNLYLLLYFSLWDSQSKLVETMFELLWDL